MSLPDDNKFKKIHDAKLIGHQLLAAKERHETIFIWRIVGDKKILAPVQIELIKRLQNEIVIRAIEGQEDLYQQVLGSSAHANFFLPHSSLLFQCTLKQSNSKGAVTLAYPAFIAQIERRKWLRMPTVDDKRVHLQFCKVVNTPKPVNQFLSKGLLDLGAGGVSFVVTKAESKFFIAGEIVRKIELLIDGTKYTVNAEVLRVSEMASHGKNPALRTWKVSLRFDGISKKDQDEVAKFVFENIRSSEKAV